MSHQNYQPPLRRKDDALLSCLERLRQTLKAEVPGREREWAEEVESALGQIETALRLHKAAARAPDGLLAQVDETRPTLARKADELRNDHEKWLARVLALREELQHAAQAFRPAAEASSTKVGGGVADFGAIRQQADELGAGLQGNWEAEMKLVLESVTTDIGVGD
jgi:hypothetical protein